MGMLTKAPELQTERLILRGHRRGDFEALAAMWAEPMVVAHITGVPSTAEASWSRLLRYAGHWALMGFGYWAVEDRASGRFVGEVGLADYHRGIDGYDGWPEAGWVLTPAFHGRGYAAEAMGAVLHWAEGALDAQKVFCILSPEHLASIRLAKRLGFSVAASATYHGEETTVMQRTMREFPRTGPRA